MQVMKPNIKIKSIIVKTSADVFMPFALVFGFYVILHGHLSPGGGFQGGVIIAAAALMMYISYGYETASHVLNPATLHKNEAFAAVCYIVLAISGIFMGSAFCFNVFKDVGEVGDLFSAGTISLMNYAVGYKVLTGVSFLALLLLGMLDNGDDEKDGDNK